MMYVSGCSGQSVDQDSGLVKYMCARSGKQPARRLLTSSTAAPFATDELRKLLFFAGNMFVFSVFASHICSLFVSFLASPVASYIHAVLDQLAGGPRSRSADPACLEPHEHSLPERWRENGGPYGSVA